MKGSSHAIVGGVVGGVVSLGVGNDPISVGTGTLVAAGTVAGLVPDLDTNGKLSGKLTISYKVIKSAMMIVGILLSLYSLINGDMLEKVLGFVVGLGIAVFANKYITQRKMLLITGIGVIIGGFVLSTLWIVLMGIYIALASVMGHRTYTHSLIGLIYFGYISYLVSVDFSQVEGLFMALVLGYISHLVCDFKVFNKQGVKLLRPFVNVEI